VNQFSKAWFNPENVSDATKDRFYENIFPQVERPAEGLLPGVLMPVLSAAIVLAVTKVQWYDRVLVPLYNGGSYSGVLTKSYVVLAGDILLIWGATYVSMYGVEQMVLLWQGDDSFVVRPPVVTYGRHPNATRKGPGGGGKWTREEQDNFEEGYSKWEKAQKEKAS